MLRGFSEKIHDGEVASNTSFLEWLDLDTQYQRSFGDGRIYNY